MFSFWTHRNKMRWSHLYSGMRGNLTSSIWNMPAPSRKACLRNNTDAPTSFQLEFIRKSGLHFSYGNQERDEKCGWGCFFQGPWWVRKWSETLGVASERSPGLDPDPASGAHVPSTQHTERWGHAAKSLNGTFFLCLFADLDLSSRASQCSS